MPNCVFIAASFVNLTWYSYRVTAAKNWGRAMSNHLNQLWRDLSSCRTKCSRSLSKLPDTGVHSSIASVKISNRNLGQKVHFNSHSNKRL